MNKIIRLINKILITIIILVIPRNEKIWVFGSWFGKRYADNSRFLFEYLSKNQDKFDIDKVIWVTDSDEITSFVRSNNGLAFKKNSLLGFYYHLRAKVFIYDQNIKDLNFNLTHGALRLNLWHGIPLKKIGFHYKPKAHNKANKVLASFSALLNSKTQDFILETSEFAGKLLFDAFEIATIRGPYPRNYFLTSTNQNSLMPQESDVLEQLRLSKKKVIFYLPTFRDKCELKFLGSDDEKVQKQLIDEIEKLGFILISKVHFAKSSQKNSLTHDNLINLPSDMDIYPFLKITDILITDYSSVYFDFLFLNREIIFLAYDLEYYKKKDRGLILDYEKYTPGVKVYDADLLISEIVKVVDGSTNFTQARNSLKNTVFDDEPMENLIFSIQKALGAR